MAERPYTVAHIPAPVARAEDELVAVYSAAGHLLGFWTAREVERNGNLRTVRTRKGRLVRAYLRDDDPAIIQRLIAEGRRSRYGSGFLQHLPCGARTWALRGVRGSR